jgi:FkbM family methyltransferase
MKTLLFPTHQANVYLHVRPDRKDDLDVMREIWCEDVYHIKDCVREAKFVIDLGANIGAFTCYVLENSEAKVWAIEPELNNLKLLEINISRIAPKRAKIIKKAVDHYEGESFITDQAGSSHLDDKGQKVTVTTINKLLEGNTDEIDIFKIDIEGSEVGVMLSMDMDVQKRVKFFAIEFDSKSKHFGKIVEKLSETHHITTLGAASRGAMIYAERY